MSDQQPSRLQVPKLLTARAMAWCILAFERLWPRVLPTFLVLMILAALTWFGVFNYLSYWPHVILLWLLLFTAVGFLFLIAGFRFPTKNEVDRRIEKASDLKNQPLETLSDNPVNSTDNDYAKILWAEHQARMASKLQHLQAGLPDTAITHYDPLALRALIIFFTVIAFAYSFGNSGGRLHDIFDFRSPIDLSSMRLDAWVTPPSYTGQAPIYLTETDIQNTKVAEGSKVTIRIIDGGDVILELQENITGKTSKIPPLADQALVKSSNSTTFEAILKTSSNLMLLARHYEKKWHFDIVPDHPPTIHLTKEPGRILSGSLELNYTLDDDYGVEKAYVEISPTSQVSGTGHPLYNAPEMKLLIPRGGKGQGRTVQDISNHPWAGSEVKLTLVAEDGAGHIAKSESRTMTLPQRSFGNPLARAVAEQRRMLALDTMSRNRVLDMVAALTLRPEETIDNYTHFLVLRSLWTRLSLATTDDELRNITDYMWQIAIGIEGDAVSQAEKNLRQAQAALRDALRNGASPEEIERLTDALRQAMNDYIVALANKSQNESPDQKPNDNMQSLSSDELAKKLKDLEDMAKTGNRAAAEQLLSELEKMMDNLQVHKGGSGQAGSGSLEMQKQLDKLGDLMRRQQEMLNETHKLEDEKQRAEKTPEQYRNGLNSLREKQKELQSELKDLQKDLTDRGFKPDEGLKDAENKMQNSGEALGQGNGEASTDSQSDALNSMRDGAKSVMQQMQEAMKKNGEAGKAEDNSSKDPLGRNLGSSGNKPDSETLPSENEMQRARKVLEEIRKRLGQSLLPETEKNYLERLLKFN